MHTVRTVRTVRTVHVACVEQSPTRGCTLQQPMNEGRSRHRDLRTIGAGASPQSTPVTPWRSKLWGGT
jgi:hypothetical protein